MVVEKKEHGEICSENDLQKSWVKPTFLLVQKGNLIWLCKTKITVLNR